MAAMHPRRIEGEEPRGPCLLERRRERPWRHVSRRRAEQEPGATFQRGRHLAEKLRGIVDLVDHGESQGKVYTAFHAGIDALTKTGPRGPALQAIERRACAAGLPASTRATTDTRYAPCDLPGDELLPTASIPCTLVM